MNVAGSSTDKTFAINLFIHSSIYIATLKDLYPEVISAQ